MTPTKIIIALGGNALQSGSGPATAEAQLEVVKETVESIAKLSAGGYELGIVHGNGPQVGRIVMASEAAKDVTPVMPFDVCGAMSQGYIGYHIQQSLTPVLSRIYKYIPVVTVVTQMVVDENDPAFQNPTKPIGPFYTKEEAERLEAEKGYTMKEDAGRGFRRVVASPLPKRIVEIEAMKQLWDRVIIVGCGGGGIPVVEKADGSLEGRPAVIDKDFAAEIFAEQMDADILMILTEVEKVAIHFNQPNQQDLGDLSVREAKQYMAEGYFAAGSMLPKVQAAVKFAETSPKKKAIITALDKAPEALEGKTGTVITNR